jgi:1,2-diacylglycerol 3-alpha-glucosyltransferase
MRIAIAGHTYHPGNNGQAIFTIHLAEGLARSGHEVHVIVPGGHFRHEEAVINQVRLHLLRSLDASHLHPGVYIPIGNGRRVWRILESNEFDVVHIQDHYPLCRSVARIAARCNIPVLGTNHFLPENLLPYLSVLPLPRKLKISILWDLMLWTYNHLQVVTTPTETAARILLRRKIRVPVMPVSCGVDTNNFKPHHQLDKPGACAHFGLDASKVIFLYVGRLDSEKRVDLLLRGLAQLRSSGEAGIQLAVAGQGAAQAELHSLARALKLGGSIRFLGYVPQADLPLLYQTADIFAMPSPEELQSIATLEAMASGRPVLAASARALPELVTNGLNGKLFEPGSPAAVAEGMAALSTAREAWPRMGWASRSRAQAHSLENTIRRYEEIYRRLGKVRRSPASGAAVRFQSPGLKSGLK